MLITYYTTNHNSLFPINSRLEKNVLLIYAVVQSNILQRILNASLHYMNLFLCNIFLLILITFVYCSSSAVHDCNSRTKTGEAWKGGREGRGGREGGRGGEPGKEASRKILGSTKKFWVN